VLEPVESALPDRALSAAALPPGAAPTGRPSARVLLRFLLGAAAFLAVVVLLVRSFRPELEGLGRGFVSHFGLFGFTLGSYLADGFHFPVPPQFYMLLSLGAGTSKLATLFAITVGSLAGGVSGYAVSRRLVRFPRLGRWIERSGGRFRKQLEGRNAYRSAVIASVTPVAFSMQCYLSGLYRLPRRAFAVILLLRIPKLLLFYWLVQLGWSGL
jgi:membrane protein YqaA with SNARE-associated domain